MLVEEQADTLKTRYLAWVYEFGEMHINGERLVDCLELRPGFSYWWTFLGTGMCDYGKLPHTYSAIRLLAIEELAKVKGITSIVLISHDRTLEAAFRYWCRNAGISFEWRSPEKTGKQISLQRRFFHLLPYPAQSAVWLAKYLWQRWPLLNKCNGFKASPDTEITFVDYLAHLDRSALATGRFASGYWNGLVEIFAQTKARANWLHLYVRHEAVPTAKHASDLIAQFNHNSAGLELHTSLDGALNVALVLASLRDYMRIAWQSWRLSRVKHHFRPNGSNLDFWPLFKQDWLDSMRGTSAMWNCLALNLFEKTLSRLPRQKLGVYLQENQGWEMAFIHAWKAAGHGTLIGVPHTTVRYWDLRYFYDPLSYLRRAKNDLPMPDRVALNGPVAIKAYCDGHYPKDQIIEVEALRYLHLATTKEVRNQGMVSSCSPRVLICGDILPAVNKQMMQWLELAANDLPMNIRYTIKPHPACSIEASDYPSLPLNMTNAPLAELLADCDVVFTSNITSAAVDAYLSAIPVIQVLDGNAFNMSPLRGLKGVLYVTNPTELAAALCNAQPRECELAEPYFCIAQSLPRWRKLLSVE